MPTNLERGGTDLFSIRVLTKNQHVCLLLHTATHAAIPLVCVLIHLDPCLPEAPILTVGDWSTRILFFYYRLFA